MGFYFRKSKGLLGGLFRLNFSKRGVGVSTGVKGARFVVGPAGTYVHLGRKGFYYKKYLGKGLFKSDKEKEQYNQLAKDFHIPAADEIPATITTSNFDRITDSESTDFINELQEKDKKIRLQKILGLYPSIIILLFVAYKLFEVTNTIEEHQNFATIKNETVNLRDQPKTENSKILDKSHKGDKFVLLGETENHWFKVLTANNDTAYVHGDLVTTSNELIKSETIRRFDDNPNMRYILFGTTFLPLFLLNLFLYSNDKRRKSIFITYELDEIVQDLQKDMLSGFKQFTNSNKKWQVVNARRTNDAKYSAGATVTVDRKELKEISSHKLPSPFFETNVKIPFIGLQNTELYFLPDRLLLKRNSKFAAVQYSNLNIDILPVSFREYNGVPSDATVADYTYKYVNKSGGADKRFSNNPRIPICAYTEYHFSSDEGINEIIMPSKSDALDDFVIQLRTIGKLQSGNLGRNINNSTSQFSTSTFTNYDIPEYDPLFQEAAELVVLHQSASTSLIQRKLKLDYYRAGEIIDQLEELGIVGKFNGSSPRKVLIKNLDELNILLHRDEKGISSNNGLSQNDFSFNYYSLLKDFSKSLSQIVQKLKTNEAILERINGGQIQSETSVFIINCVIYDMIQISNILAKGKLSTKSLEATGLVLVTNQLLLNNSENMLDMDFDTLVFAHQQGLYQNIAKQLLLDIGNMENPMQVTIQEKQDEKVISSTEQKNNLAFPTFLKISDNPLFEEYATILYRYATIISKADNIVTKTEERLLKDIYQITHNPIPEKKNEALHISKGNKNESLDDVLNELNSLIGLNDVKAEINTLINFIKVQKAREQSGLKSSSLSYHIVFTGNPGTGKTTVARIVAKIYKHLDILTEGQLVETDRSGLVAEYVGQTAVKVNKTVNSALNGVLFIDEAYSLVGENKDDFGREAVATLIKRMEDDRDKLALILAGYTNEMTDFIDTNPGFKSRFNRYITFPDYTPNELFDIFESKCNRLDYHLTEEAKTKLKSTFENAYSSRDKSFGNGRFVRNIFEKTLEQQANRIAKEATLTKEILTTITEDDVSGVYVQAN